MRGEWSEWYESGVDGIIKPLQPIERKQGCWNCKYWDNQEKARAVWNHKRLGNLTEAQALVQLHSDQGESHPRVVSIRRMVDNVDRAVAAGLLGVCSSGKSNSDLVHNGYLCPSWTGRLGASVAIAGEGADKLPEELKADQEDALKKGNGQ